MAERVVLARISAIPAIANRVYPLTLPQNVLYPAVRFERIGAPRTSAMGRDIPLVGALIQVDIFGEIDAGYPAFSAVYTAVRQSLQRFKDPTGTPSVDDVFIERDADDYEDETRLYRKTYDFRIWYRE